MPIQSSKAIDLPILYRSSQPKEKLMKPTIARCLAILLITLFSVQSICSTCCGGGGGGVGDMPGGGKGGPEPVAYHVPWKNWTPKDTPAMGLVLYWFPATQKELNESSLLTSRILSVYAAQCVAMRVVDYRMPDVKE